MNIITMEKDFKKVVANTNLPQDVEAVVKRINTFKVPVHPRIRMFYRLLQKTVAAQTYRTSDTLYSPNRYN